MYSAFYPPAESTYGVVVGGSVVGGGYADADAVPQPVGRALYAGCVVGGRFGCGICYNVRLVDWYGGGGAVLGTLVLLLVIGVAKRVRSNVSLLIVGMMFGSIAGALVNLLQNFSNPDALKLFVVWTLGSLSSVGWAQMPYLAGVIGIGALLSVLLLKPLNGLLLGEDYARGLGIAVGHTRLLIVLATGLLAGGVTAFCGPIAFIGVAVPHIARGVFRSSNHRMVVPAAALIGADILLVCDLICSCFTYPLPISTVSALFGAPIIIHIVLKGNKINV